MPIRTARLLVPALLLGSLSLPQSAGSQSAPEVTARPIYRPLFCETIKRLGVDYLDDEIEGALARDTRTGTMPAEGPARFQVYGLTHENRFWANVSAETRHILVRVRRAPGSAPVPGVVRYVERGRMSGWEFRLQRRTPRDRKAILRFTYRCTAPTARYQCEFELDIPGTQSNP